MKMWRVDLYTHIQQKSIECSQLANSGALK